jgi:hypothetical protein
MAIESLIVWLVIGAVAGFLAGLLVTGYGFGTVGNIVVGKKRRRFDHGVRPGWLRKVLS